MKTNKKQMIELGKKLKSAREELGMSKIVLGRILGVSGTGIGNWEAGLVRPSSVFRCKIKNELNIDVDRELGIIISESEFASIFGDLRCFTGLNYKQFAKKIGVKGSTHIKEWEYGERYPIPFLMERIVSVFGDFPKIEDLKAAWELETEGSELVANQWKSGNWDVIGKEEWERMKADAVTSDVSDIVKESEPVDKVEYVAEPVSVPEPYVVQDIYVYMGRVVDRIKKEGYSIDSRNVQEILDIFTQIIVAETFCKKEGRNYLEIPWPLPLEHPGAERIYVIKFEDGDMGFTKDPFEFDWLGYNHKHNMNPVLTFSQAQETNMGFFK